MLDTCVAVADTGRYPVKSGLDFINSKNELMKSRPSPPATLQSCCDHDVGGLKRPIYYFAHIEFEPALNKSKSKIRSCGRFCKAEAVLLSFILIIIYHFTAQLPFSIITHVTLLFRIHSNMLIC